LNWGEFRALLHYVVVQNNNNHNTTVNSRGGPPAANRTIVPLIEGKEKSPTAVIE